MQSVARRWGGEAYVFGIKLIAFGIRGRRRARRGWFLRGGCEVWVESAHDLVLLLDEASASFDIGELVHLVAEPYAVEKALAPVSPGQAAIAGLAAIFERRANVDGGGQGLDPVQHEALRRRAEEELLQLEPQADGVFAHRLEKMGIRLVQLATRGGGHHEGKRRAWDERRLPEIRGDAGLGVLQAVGAQQLARGGRGAAAEEAGLLDAVQAQLGAGEDGIDVAPLAAARDVEGRDELLLDADDALHLDGAGVGRGQRAGADNAGFLLGALVQPLQHLGVQCARVRGRRANGQLCVGVVGVVVAIGGRRQEQLGLLGLGRGLGNRLHGGQQQD